MQINLPESVHTRESQAKTLVFEGEDADGAYTGSVYLRYDDELGNGHNTFAITGTVTRPTGPEHGGAMWDSDDGRALLKKHLPQLLPAVKWHLWSANVGPFHYIANTTFWASDKDWDGSPKEPNLEFARSSAGWPEATLEELRDRELLAARLPAMLHEFKGAVEALGFTY